MLSLLLVLLLVALAIVLLGHTPGRHQVDSEVTHAVSAVEALLPQTQCHACGFPGCRPYAEAMVTAGVPVNLCPPGGEATVHRLAELLGCDPEPLVVATPQAVVARIDEELCIGCTKCIQACPVDAIVGATKLMHTVIADGCTGCELCLPPCPVDCIELLPITPFALASASQVVTQA